MVFSKTDPIIYFAGYINSKTKLCISDRTLNDVINKKCQLATKLAHMTEEERKLWKGKNAASAKASREKKKLMKSTAETSEYPTPS